MSTDVQVVCHTCRLSWHLGQRMADRYSFGYGTGDIEAAGRAMELIFEHLDHGVTISLDVPDDYTRIELQSDQLTGGT